MHDGPHPVILGHRETPRRAGLPLLDQRRTENDPRGQQLGSVMIKQGREIGHLAECAPISLSSEVSSVAHILWVKIRVACQDVHAMALDDVCRVTFQWSFWGAVSNQAPGNTLFRTHLPRGSVGGSFEKPGHIQSSFRDTIPREVGAPTESGQDFQPGRVTPCRCLSGYADPAGNRKLP